MHRCLPVVAFALAASVPAHAHAQAPATGRLPDDVVPVEYRIDITPDAAGTAFRGTVDIVVDIARPTRRIVLDATELSMDRVTLSGESRAPHVRLDADRQHATFEFDHPLAVGRRTLSIAYGGRINTQAVGLFGLKYATADGEKQALFTQFEQTDARRFVPCWDEPALKAVFVLSATLPAGEMAVGNMPVASIDTVQRPGDEAKLQHVHFQPTPRMSSYLLFFGAGDFERVHREVDGIDVGVVVKRGDTASARYALDAAATILPFYDDYFGVKYPLPKLDMIGGPGDSIGFGAMENWGALFYFEQDLLVDPRIATEENRQDVFLTVAHEMAHQWFGDLVTMRWWDNIWLNEGMAEWMQHKAAERLHPEWQPWLQSLRRKDSAMGDDARAGTHPLVSPVPTEATADGLFDAITYQKGSQVARTVEMTVGEDAFRAGIRRYMSAHRYGSVDTADLWAAIATPASPEIRGIAHDLTMQAGVPLLRERSVACRGGRTRIELVQDELRIGDGAKAPPAAGRWRLPVEARALARDEGPARADAGDVAAAPVAHGVVAGPRPVTLELPGCAPVVLNAGQHAYYRTRYTDAALGQLVRRFDELAPEDQLGLVEDTTALALAGDVSMAALGDLVRALPGDVDPVVARGLVDKLRELDDIATGSPARPAVRDFARRAIAPIVARIGWTPREGEGPSTGQLREAALETMGSLGDPDVVAQARERFAAFAREPASLDAATRRIVLDVVARNADEATWDALHRLAREAPTMLERQEFYSLLAAARDPAQSERALALVLSGEPPATFASGMLNAAAKYHAGAVLDWLGAHWDRMSDVLGTVNPGPSTATLMANASDPSLVPRIEAFAKAHVPEGGRRSLVVAEANIRYRAQVREQRLPELARWVAAREVTRYSGR